MEYFFFSDSITDAVNIPQLCMYVEDYNYRSTIQYSVVAHTQKKQSANME